MRCLVVLFALPCFLIGQPRTAGPQSWQTSKAWVASTSGTSPDKAYAPGVLPLTPITPCRILDTRNPPGSFGGPALGAGQERSIAVPAGSCGIPVTAQAYSLNITVVPSVKLGYLSVWPSGQPRPLVSTLNSTDGDILANAAIVPAGTNGAISVFATDLTQVIIDINGYFATGSASGSLPFYTVPPCRVVDTRFGQGKSGAFGPPELAARGIRSFPIAAGGCGVPANAAAYSFNFTVAPRAALGYLTAWPTGIAQPFVSTLNSPRGAIVANAAIIPAGTEGSISVFATDATDLILDINGYFAP